LIVLTYRPKLFSPILLTPAHSDCITELIQQVNS
jgi:hypothetical protein